MEPRADLVDLGGRERRTRRQILLAVLGTVSAGRPAGAQSGPVFHGYALDHVKIIVADVNRSRKFYETLLGVQRGVSTATGLGGEHVVLPSGRGHLSLEPPRPGERTGVIEHICIAVDENVGDVRERVVQAIPDVQVHVEKESGAIFFLDPDGAWVQIVRKA